MHIIYNHKTKTYLISIALWICIITLLYYSKSCFFAATDAIKLYIYTLLPAVFLFIFITHYLIKTDLIKYLSFKIDRILSKLFKLSNISSSVFVIGSIFGYPSGIKYSTYLLESKQISNIEYTKLLLFTNNPSITYILSSIGIGMFGNMSIGVIFFLSITISNILIGISYRPNTHNSIIQQTDTMSNNFPKKKVSFSENFFASIKETFYSISLIFAFTIIFSISANIICNILKISGIYSSIVYGFLEITKGINMLASSLVNLNTKIIIISFFLGFSSFMVIMQLFTVSYKYISFKLLITAKLLQGFLSAIISYLLINIFKIGDDLQVFSNKFTNNAKVDISHILCYLLYTLLLIFILIQIKRKKRLA